MISRVAFSDKSLVAGQTRDIAVWGDGPHTLEIKCFVSAPPPPGYRACSECGSVVVENGEVYPVRASQKVFGDRGGELRIIVTDAKGDRRLLSLKVEAAVREPEAGAAS